MEYKTVSYCFKVKDIVSYLVHELGYVKTNLRTVLIKDLGLYKTNKDIKENHRIANHTLYVPLVYRDDVGHSLLVESVRNLIENTKKRSRIDCSSLYYFYSKNLRLSVSTFRAEHVFQQRIDLILSQNNVIKNEKNSGYLP